MCTATLDYLLKHDNTPSSEWPEGFNHTAEMAKVRTLGETLAAITGHPLRLDDKVHDANFFAEWAAFDSTPRPWPGCTADVRLCLVAVRFSAYGRMFTVWGNSPEHPLTEETVKAVTDYLDPLGYVLVPQTLLYSPHPSQGPEKTWCSRFFSYQDHLDHPQFRGFLRKKEFAVV